MAADPQPPVARRVRGFRIRRSTSSTLAPAEPQQQPAARNYPPQGRTSASASRPPAAFAPAAARATSTGTAPPRRANCSTYPPTVLTRPCPPTAQYGLTGAYADATITSGRPQSPLVGEDHRSEGPASATVTPAGFDSPAVQPGRAAVVAGEGPEAREGGGSQGGDEQRGPDRAVRQCEGVEVADGGHGEQQHEGGERGDEQGDPAP